MHPPLSMIFFTTLAGAAQGLLLVLVGVDLARVLGLAQPAPVLFTGGAVLVLLLGVAGLIAATFHLGRPMRAWRAASMWRTSWLSREVIALPVFLALVFFWGVAHGVQAPTLLLGLGAAVMALVLYVCTGMIYGAVKAIREWATPLTPVNYALIGIASGLVLATALAAWTAPALLPVLVPAAVVATVLAACIRGATLWRNLHLAPKTTLQTAIGVRHPRIQQKSQGAMGGSFNTREYFHGRSPAFVRGARWGAALLGFVLPGVVLAVGGAALGALALSVLFGLQVLGLLAERWCFFAEARHPQNLYYSTVS